MTPDDDLYDVTQAALYLGEISTRTVYREVGRGRLRMVKVGGSTRFRRTELDRYIRSQERTGHRVAWLTPRKESS